MLTQMNCIQHYYMEESHTRQLVQRITSQTPQIDHKYVQIVECWNKRFYVLLHYDDHAGVSNHQPHGCLLNRLFRRKSKKTSKHRVTGLCAGNSPGTGEFPAQMASYAENVSIWWRHQANTKTGVGGVMLPIVYVRYVWCIFSVVPSFNVY